MSNAKVLFPIPQTKHAYSMTDDIYIYLCLYHVKKEDESVMFL